MKEPGKNPVYVAFYKPFGVLTAFTDPEGRETLKQYIDLPDIYPAGRLDYDSEGLLLLTDDGDLAHRLTDPHFNHPKTYLVQVEGVLLPEALAKLESGVEVKGEKTRRAQVISIAEPNVPERRKPVTPHGPTAWLRIVLREGKKRQIRHMTAAVGLPTLRIVRIAVGPVSLNELQPGQWRFLDPAEVKALKDLVKTAQRPARPVGEKTKIRTSRPDAPKIGGETKNPPAGRRPSKTPKAGGTPAGSPGSNRGSQYRSGVRRRPGR